MLNDFHQLALYTFEKSELYSVHSAQKIDYAETLPCGSSDSDVSCSVATGTVRLRTL